MSDLMNLKKMAFKSAACLLTFCLLAFSPFGAVCLGAMDSDKKDIDLSVEEKEALVTQGIAQYRGGDRKGAKKTFEQAKSASSENAAVPYYLGLIYLEENRRSDAIAEWQQYVPMDPDSETSLKIRKYLTLLLRKEAVAYAKAAVANEAALMDGPVAENTVAVTSFSNLGSETLGPLGKGLAAMLISDLTQVPDLQVVERVRLQALLQEMDLGTSGVVDPETVPKVGKLLKSRHVATGSLADSTEKSLQIFSAVVDTEQADRIDTREAQGAIEEFFTLEKQIACGIIDDIGRNCSEMPEAFNKVHTKSLAALTSYSVGLDYLDQEKYDQAREQFQKALEEDPDFDLAKETLAMTPLASMLFMSSSQMVSSLSAGTAGGGGLSTGWMIAGGVVGAAAIAAAAAGGGGGGEAGGSSADGDDGNGDGGEPSADVDLTGDWTGSWSASGNETGRIFLSLTQTGTSVSGTAEVEGPDCTLNGNVSGTVENSSFQATITGSGSSAVFNAACTPTSMNGTLEATSGGCAGFSGSVSVTITGSATVRW